MKTFRIITAMVLIVGLIGVFSAFSAEQTTQGKKEAPVTEKKESQDQKKGPASTIQAPAAAVQSLPLIITRLYLKDGKVHVVIKKQGSKRLSDEDYKATKLKIEASTLIKPLEWTLLEVDPQKRLNHVRREKDFDTGLAVTERTRVTATLYRGLWKTAKEGTLYPMMAKVDTKTSMGTSKKKDTSRIPTSLPADQPASADSSASRPPGFGDSGSSAPSTARIQVIEPNGGEFWEECNLGTVRWHYSGPASDMPRIWAFDLMRTPDPDRMVLYNFYILHNIRSSDCCVPVRDPRETYYECTKSLAGPCVPEGDYRITVRTDEITGGVGRPPYVEDSSDDPFQIGMSEGFTRDDVRIQGFNFGHPYDGRVNERHASSVEVWIWATALGHGLDFVAIEFRGHTVFRIDNPDDTYFGLYNPGEAYINLDLELDLSEYATENGTYPITAYAEDRMGNSDSHTLHLNVDLDDPTMIINSPREDAIFCADPVSEKANVTFDITASDDSSEVTRIRASIHDSRTYDLCYLSPCSTTLEFPVGEYTVTVSARDMADNQVEREINFSVVRSPFDRPAGSSLPGAPTNPTGTMGEPEDDDVPIPPIPPEER